ncbi:MAG: PKD domain-containing protein [Terriglobia bacterium]
MFGLGAYDVFHGEAEVPLDGGVVRLPNQPHHSVRLLKLIDTAIRPAAPSLALQQPRSAQAGGVIDFSARPVAGSVPALAYRWDFGDGTGAAGERASHAYTTAGQLRRSPGGERH